MIAEVIAEEKEDQGCLNQQVYYNLLAEEIAEQDEVMAEEERRERQQKIAERILAEEDARSYLDGLFGRAYEKMIAEEFAEQDGALAEEEEQEESRWRYRERLIAEEEARAKRSRRGRRGEEIRRVAFDTAGTTTDENAFRGRPRKRPRREILDSLKRRLAWRFEVEASVWEAGDRERKRIRRARCEAEDAALAERARRDWSDMQDQDESLADVDEEAEEALWREQERIFAEEYADEEARRTRHAVEDEVLTEEAHRIWSKRQNQDEILAEADAEAEEAWRREQEKIFAEEYKGEETKRARHDLEDEVLAEQARQNWLERQDRDKLLAEGGAEAEEIRHGEQERIFAEEYVDEEDNPHHNLVHQEIAEQDEALAEAEGEDDWQGEQERIYVEEYVDEDIERIFAEEILYGDTENCSPDYLHGRAHYDLVEQEIAEQEEALAEQGRREMLYEREQ